MDSKRKSAHADSPGPSSPTSTNSSADSEASSAIDSDTEAEDLYSEHKLQTPDEIRVAKAIKGSIETSIVDEYVVDLSQERARGSADQTRSPANDILSELISAKRRELHQLAEERRIDKVVSNSIAVSMVDEHVLDLQKELARQKGQAEPAQSAAMTDLLREKRQQLHEMAEAKLVEHKARAHVSSTDYITREMPRVEGRPANSVSTEPAPPAVTSKVVATSTPAVGNTSRQDPEPAPTSSRMTRSR